jgi:hypothetical protein
LVTLTTKHHITSDSTFSFLWVLSIEYFSLLSFWINVSFVPELRHAIDSVEYQSK